MAFGTPRRAPSHDASHPRDDARREFALALAHTIDSFAPIAAERTPRERTDRRGKTLRIATRAVSQSPHACDARRTMVSLNARRNERSRSNKASEIINGFLSSPVRVFYSILFICALEVRDFVDAMRRARNHREGAKRGAIVRASTRD
jgi:hypothetical protein